MLTCTLFTSIAFANNDTLNTKANNNEAYFYPQVNVQNKTRFTATVKITYPGCKNDENIVIAPGGTGLGKSGLARAGCLVTKIEATFAGNGAASVTQITNFSSTGTGASNFIIQESALNEEETQFECMVYRTDKEGMVIGVKPGFVVWNKTTVPVFLAIKVGISYYSSMVLPGKKYECTTGSFWFRMKAEVCLDGIPRAADVVEEFFTLGLLMGMFPSNSGWVSLGKNNPLAGLGVSKFPSNPPLRFGKDTTSGIVFNTANAEKCENEIHKSGSIHTILDSQYSGASDVFSKQSEKPTYEITEGIYYDETQNLVVTRKLCLKKINTVGNNMMLGSKKSSCN